MSVEFRQTDESMRAALDRTIEEIAGKTVTLRDLLALIGEQGLLLLCALLCVPFLLPVSIPGVSTVFGLAIILISIGLLTNRSPWIPRKLMDRPLDAEKLVPVLKRGSSMVARIEKVIRPRLTWLTDGRTASLINALGIMLGAILLLFPLGLVPFSNTLPGYAILFLCIGVSQRDGAVVIGGYVLIVATIVYFGVLAWLALAAGQSLTNFFFG